MKRRAPSLRLAALALGIWLGCSAGALYAWHQSHEAWLRSIIANTLAGPARMGP